MSCTSGTRGSYEGGDVSSPYFGGDETYQGGSTIWVNKYVKEGAPRYFSIFAGGLFVVFCLSMLVYMIAADSTSRDLDVFFGLFSGVAVLLLVKDIIEFGSRTEAYVGKAKAAEAQLAQLANSQMVK